MRVSQGFWRNWNASLNRWLVRYLYVPQGGSDRLLRGTSLAFLFVAIWYRVQWQMLVWALCATLLFQLEQVSTPVHGSVTEY